MYFLTLSIDIGTRDEDNDDNDDDDDCADHRNVGAPQVVDKNRWSSRPTLHWSLV